MAPFPGEQLIVRAQFGRFAIPGHQQSVGILERREPVGDGERRPALD